MSILISYNTACLKHNQRYQQGAYISTETEIAKHKTVKKTYIYREKETGTKRLTGAVDVSTVVPDTD